MSNGSLLIAGGEVSASSNKIFSAYIAAAGGVHKRFVLLPSASSEPDAAFLRHVRTLVNLGVPESNISLLEVSLARPQWQNGARNSDQLAKAEQADAFWIYGGDQNALVEALQERDGTDTPLLALMRKKLAQGCVIGGSSAGAAVMGDIMLGGGTSFGAMAELRAETAAGEEISDALLTATGFGFFSAGVIDQHFDTRARLMRLAEVAFTDDARRPAFGIAEDTAIVVDLEKESIDVIGSGGVYILNPDIDGRTRANGRLRIQNLGLSYLTEGDRYSFDTGVVCFPGKKEILPGTEYYSVEKPIASGVLSGYGTLAAFIANFVVDNKLDCLFEDKIGNVMYGKSFLMGTGLKNDDDLLCWEIHLGRRPGFTRGWAGARTSFENVIVDIIPVSISITLLS